MEFGVNITLEKFRSQAELKSDVGLICSNLLGT